MLSISWEGISLFDGCSASEGSKEESERDELHLAKDLTNPESEDESVCWKKYWGARTYQRLRQGVGADYQV